MIDGDDCTWTCCYQHLFILVDKNSIQKPQWFSHQRGRSKLSYFGTTTNGSHNLVDSAASVAWNLVIFPDTSSFPVMWAISRPLAHFPTLIDQPMQASIDCKHPKIIDAARESVIARLDKSTHCRFSMNYQMRTFHFHWMLSLARSRFFSFVMM